MLVIAQLTQRAGDDSPQQPFVHPTAALLGKVGTTSDLAQRMDERPAEHAAPAAWVVGQAGLHFGDRRLIKREAAIQHRELEDHF